MLNIVFPERKGLEEYVDLIGREAYEEIVSLAKPLAGKRVLHINATETGGGVAELLRTLVPLTNSVGLQADWAVMRGAPEFFDVTKAMHNSLQGNNMAWTEEMWDIWRRYNKANAQDLEMHDYDFVVVHDPQPAALLNFVRNRNSSTNGRWLWRCHIDLTDASEEVWDVFMPFLDLYDGLVFTMPTYVKEGLNGYNVAIIPPGIDPLTPKNTPLPPEVQTRVLSDASIDPDRPIISQISRFDPWKDPLGVIDVYKKVKHMVKGLQLVMVAAMAGDDPEGWVYYEKTLRHAGEDPDIHFLVDLFGRGNDVPVNVVQSASKVVLQKSIREGFGLVVTEALWKGKPVVAGDAGGIRLQVRDGETGYLASTTDDFAERTLQLLKDPAEGERLGSAAKEHVRENYLITRLLRDYLTVFNQLNNGA